MSDQEIIDRLKIRLEAYMQAMASLSELDCMREYSELEKTGFLQRFEFCFELSWKLIKSLLEYEGVNTKSPRESIKQGLKTGVIADGHIWVKMQESRNILSHTYNQSKAIEVFSSLANYIPIYEKLLSKAQATVESIT